MHYYFHIFRLFVPGYGKATDSFRASISYREELYERSFFTLVSFLFSMSVDFTKNTEWSCNIIMETGLFRFREEGEKYVWNR